METYVKSANIMSKPKIGNFLHSLSINIPIKQFLYKLLFLIKAVVEYTFGMHIGFAAGWLLGLLAGNHYVGYFKPVYMNEFSRLPYWRLLPYEFAQAGAAVGIFAGIIAIAAINNKLLTQRVMSLYEKGNIELNDISCFIGKSERKVRKILQKHKKDNPLATVS